MGFSWLLRFVVGALAIIVVAEFGARATIALADAPVLRWHDYSSQLKVEQMNATEQAEIVVVGTSMAQQDLVPSVLREVLGESVYNAGLNGGIPVVTEPWLLDQVLPRLEPETVLWGLSPLDMSAAYGDATKNAYDQALETKSGWLAEVDRFGSHYLTLISSRAALRDPAKLLGADNAAAAEEARAALGNEGERIDFSVQLGVNRQTEISGRIKPFVIDREDLAAIARTVRELQAQNIGIYFIELPVPQRFVSLYGNGPTDQELNRSAIATLGAELGVTVIRPNAEFGDDEFVDFTHLNKEAAERFSRDIASQVARQ